MQSVPSEVANSYRVRFPSYLTQWDRRFLEEVLFHHKAYVGRTQSDLRAHLRMLYAEDKVQWSRCLLIFETISRLSERPRLDKKEIFELRKDAFVESAAHIRDKQQIAGLEHTEIFQDLKNKILIHASPSGLGALQLMQDVNVQISKKIVMNASKLRISMSSHVRRLVNESIKMGLICHVISTAPQFVVEISGPLSILRKTRIYGRFFLELLPAISIAKKFQIMAFDFDNGLSPFLLQSGDPLPMDANPSKYDSLLEEQFAAELSISLPGWKVEREAAPIRLGDKWMFPDFVVTPPGGDTHWIVELMGYHTADYVKHKQAQMRAALPPNMIFVISKKIFKHFKEFEEVHKMICFDRFVPTEKIVRELQILERI